MPFDFSGAVGDLVNYGPAPQPTQKVTDLSPHVDGGQASARGSNATASDKRILHTAIAIVLLAVVFLWLLGGIAFRSATL